jgi:hypothetical protein
MGLSATLLIYLIAGVGVAIAVYLSDSASSPGQRWFSVATALTFWPLYVPLLLARTGNGPAKAEDSPALAPPDDLALAIAQVDTELETALGSLKGWGDHLLIREKTRLQELRSAWTAQAERIREMDRLLALPDLTTAIAAGTPNPPTASQLSPAVRDRLRQTQQVVRQNLDELRRVRQRAYDDLMTTLAWVRELVSMIPLAKFTGGPTTRAEELLAQILTTAQNCSEPIERGEDRVAG